MRRESWDGPRATGPKGHLSVHGPERSLGNVRIAVRQAHEKVTAAEAALRQRHVERDAAVRVREERFSVRSMRLLSNTAAIGLKLSNLDEFRSLKYEPPPLVQLAVRCVCTLVSADDTPLTDAETAQIRALELAALKAEERRIAKTRPQSARASSSSITGTGTHTKEYDAMHGVRWPREAEIAQSGTFRPRVVPARSPPKKTKEEQLGWQSARDSRTDKLMTWRDSVEQFAKPNFKWRLRNLNGRKLLESAELVEAVRAVLDLSTIKQGQPFTILPGRSHPGDTSEQAKSRRELTSAIYREYDGAGVATRTSGLQFEEARYCCEVAGAMLIWIKRVLALQDQLRKTWAAASQAIEDAEERVIPAKRRLDELRDWTEELTEELNATWRKVQQAKQKMLRRGGYESEAARSGGHEEQSTKGEVYQIL